MHLSLADFCETIKELESNAHKALAVLWFHDQRQPNIAMKAGQLAKILDDHRVGTPHSTTLADQIRAMRLANDLKSGFSLKPGSRKEIHDWLPKTGGTPSSSDAPPDFASLVTDMTMREILQHRWFEIVCCLEHGAPLAAVVMMGGLLESLFVAKQREFSDKTPLINATRAPTKEGKKLAIQKWTLNDYIEVGNELGWIGDAGKSVSVVMRDYRNLIHPEVQHAKRIEVKPSDARLIWDVTKGLARELLN